MRLLLCTLLVVGFGCGEMPLSPEEQKAVELARQFLEKQQRDWGTPIEVKPPPSKGDIIRGQENQTYTIVYATPYSERSLGPRTILVNVETGAVRYHIRK